MKYAFFRCSKPIFLFAVLALWCADPATSIAQVEDSIVSVQAFTFDDEPTRHRWGNIYEYDGLVEFPDSGGRYERILMLYTLRCDPSTRADNLPCGEWDYSTWTRVWDDSTTHWEIGRFITPYGIRLDLGPEGVTWVFDVTDYAPILNGTKRVTSGNSQELLDLEFRFIKGVPPRDPISVTRLWEPGSHSYEKITEDSLLSPIDIELDPNATMYRINTRPQGGNFNGGPDTDNCAEFCDREHWLRVDGQERFRWNVWNECADNPVYPQGGTWVYDRAGWCPGAIVTTQHHELTPYVTPGSTVTIDYGIENPAEYRPYGHWVFWADLIAYGAPNFEVNPTLLGIEAPNSEPFFGRHNPICSSPVVVIRNSGTETLTSLRFTYGTGDVAEYSHDWTGSLEFLETDTVRLPPLPIEAWGLDDSTFVVEIAKPNGVNDEYVNDNRLESRFENVELMPSELQVRLTTNQMNALFQQAYELRILDASGNVVLGDTVTANQETLNYDLSLDDGCYTLILRNPTGYGLDFWAIRDQLGTGALEIRSRGSRIKAFQPDFGNEIRYEFRTPASRLKVEDGETDTIDVGTTKVGSPTTTTIELGPANSAGIKIKNVLFLNGRPQFNIADTRPSLELGAVQVEAGETMEVDVRFDPTAVRPYIGRMIITSSDVAGTRSVYVRGEATGPSSVQGGDQASQVEPIVEIEPNVISETAVIRFGPERKRSERTTLELLDANGQLVATLFDRPLQHVTELEIDASDYASGHYFIRCRTEDGVATGEFRVVK